jgi:hypothetical protein
MKKITCSDCGSAYGVTWADQRSQFGRLIRRGVTRDQIKDILPRCGKCVTVWMRANAVATSNAPLRPRRRPSAEIIYLSERYRQ